MPLFLFLIVFMSASNNYTFTTTGENVLLINNYHPQNNYDMRLFRLSADEIKSAEVRWGALYRRTLEINEIQSLVRILHRVNKEDIEPYHEPAPKVDRFQSLYC